MKIPLHFKREKNLLVYGGSNLPWPCQNYLLYNLTTPGFNGLLTAQLISKKEEDVFFFFTFNLKPTHNFYCHSYSNNFLSHPNNFYASARSLIEENILEKLLLAYQELENITPNVTKMDNCFEVKIHLFNTKFKSIFPSKPAENLECQNTYSKKVTMFSN